MDGLYESFFVNIYLRSIGFVKNEKALRVQGFVGFWSGGLFRFGFFVVAHEKECNRAGKNCKPEECADEDEIFATVDDVVLEIFDHVDGIHFVGEHRNEALREDGCDRCTCDEQPRNQVEHLAIHTDCESRDRNDKVDDCKHKGDGGEELNENLERFTVNASADEVDDGGYAVEDCKTC